MGKQIKKNEVDIDANEILLTDEEINQRKEKIVTDITKIDKSEILTYSFDEVKEEKKSFWTKLKKIFSNE